MSPNSFDFCSSDCTEARHWCVYYVHAVDQQAEAAHGLHISPAFLLNRHTLRDTRHSLNGPAHNLKMSLKCIALGTVPGFSLSCLNHLGKKCKALQRFMLRCSIKCCQFLLFAKNSFTTSSLLRLENVR